MPSLDKSESVTICPCSVASLATQCFNSTMSPASLASTALISVAVAATRLRFCSAKSEALVAVFARSWAHAEGAFAYI